MTALQKIQLRLSEIRSRLGAIAELDELTDEVKAESETLQNELQKQRVAGTGGACV